MINKRGFEVSFAWIFAMIVGSVILFIAVYATVTLVNTSRLKTDSETAYQLGILLNPVETNLESGRYAVIEFPSETRVFNSCRTIGNFGQQGIRAAVKSGIGKDFQNPGVESTFFNKYLFSREVEQGKKLHLFVKPLKLPYKIGDLIFASAGEYCFIDAPGDVEDEINDLNIGNVELVSDVEECSSESRKVCFANANCDVDVNTITQVVTIKMENAETKDVYYEGNLIYGAIFSDPEIYECQVIRLMKRAGELAHLYKTKTEILSSKGCSSNLAGDLNLFASQIQINEGENSFKLSNIKILSDNLGRRNDLLSCKLF